MYKFIRFFVALLFTVSCVKALEEKIDIVNDAHAFEQCGKFDQNDPIVEHRIFTKGQFQYQMCSLTCQYRYHGQARSCVMGGCTSHPYEENRLQSFNLNEGLACPMDSKGICHDGTCRYKESILGNVTFTIESIDLNPEIYKKDTFAQCNIADGRPGLSAMIVCIDSRNPNSTTFKHMYGFSYDLGQYAVLKNCDLLQCYFPMDRLDRASYCHYDRTQLPAYTDNINFIFQKHQSHCVLDVIQFPLRQLMNEHRAGQVPHRVRQLEFTELATKMNVTMDWTGMIPF